jgi:hypothetical protein
MRGADGAISMAATPHAAQWRTKDDTRAGFPKAYSPLTSNPLPCQWVMWIWEGRDLSQRRLGD